MITTIFSTFFGKFKFYIGFILLAVIVYFYVVSLRNEIESQKLEDERKAKIIEEKDADIKNIVEAYEKTLAIEKQIEKQKAVTTEQKEVVVTKYKTLIKEVAKRGEIKQDEKSNFTIVTF